MGVCIQKTYFWKRSRRVPHTYFSWNYGTIRLSKWRNEYHSRHKQKFAYKFSSKTAGYMTERIRTTKLATHRTQNWSSKAPTQVTPEAYILINVTTPSRVAMTTTDIDAFVSQENFPSKSYDALSRTSADDSEKFLNLIQETRQNAYCLCLEFWGYSLAQNQVSNQPRQLNQRLDLIFISD